MIGLDDGAVLGRWQWTTVQSIGRTLVTMSTAHTPGTRYRIRLHPMDWPTLFDTARHGLRVFGVPVRWDEMTPRGTYQIEWRPPR